MQSPSWTSLLWTHYCFPQGLLKVRQTGNSCLPVPQSSWAEGETGKGERQTLFSVCLSQLTTRSLTVKPVPLPTPSDRCWTNSSPGCYVGFKNEVVASFSLDSGLNQRLSYYMTARALLQGTAWLGVQSEQATVPTLRLSLMVESKQGNDSPCLFLDPFLLLPVGGSQPKGQAGQREEVGV